LKAAQKDVDKVNATIKEAEERRSSTQEELSLLEQYSTAVATTISTEVLPDPTIMKNTLQIYHENMKGCYDTIAACEEKLTELEEEREKKQKALEKEQRRFTRANRAKAEERLKKKAEREERRREKKEKKPEKLANVYRVRITIELPSSDVTASKSNDADDVLQDATLDLTYTTSSASWTPHYDLRLDTTNPSLSTLTYRAHFTNRTYETWSHALLTLSTSQASFGGLSEKIPQMESWRVTLGKKYHTLSGENGLYSLAEMKAKEEEQKATYVQDSGQRQQQQDQERIRALASAGKNRKSVKQRAPVGSSARFFSSAPTPPAPSSVPGGMMLYGAPMSIATDSIDEEVELGGDIDGITIAGGATAIGHSLAGSDTYGFTTTYELPTPRTIPSSALVRRHVIAEIPLPSLVFTHILIPKLKAAAFLKAKVTNTSSIPLLPGAAGLTLDGSFMGNLSFPRCSPSETVTLELGVDQGVKVEYERPTVKHGTQGMLIMGKEEVGAYKRRMRLTNTKLTTISLVVLDQIPQPEDERLKVTILAPKGLKDVDDVAKHGVGVDGKSTASEKKKAVVPSTPSKLDDIPETASFKGSVGRSFSFSKGSGSSSSKYEPAPSAPVLTVTPSPAQPSIGSGWGTAKATLKKNGEVRWDVDLYKGGVVALALEWECRMPSGDGVHALS
jgi:hypothetical protein